MYKADVTVYSEFLVIFGTKDDFFWLTLKYVIHEAPELIGPNLWMGGL